MRDIRVSPTETNPTHHVSIQDRTGKEVGLILCDEYGMPVKSTNSFMKSPVDTTAQKQTSGASSYDAYDYPYAPIVQDDLSGGRGNKDFERDSTKFLDSYRARSGRPNMVFAGPQESYVPLRTTMQNMPGWVTWHKLTEDRRVIFKRIQSSTAFTAANIWIIARRKGTPQAIRLSIYSDSAGAVGGELAYTTATTTDLDDVLSEWLNKTISQAVGGGGLWYWIVIEADEVDNNDSHWLIGVKPSAGTTYVGTSGDSTAASFDLYYRLTQASTTTKCIPFEYQEQQYFVISPESGAPSLYVAGERGCADPNTGQLSRLTDATKAWTVNEHTGSIVVVIDGPGKDEEQPWRQVSSNGTNYLIVNADWKIEHTVNTVYVLLSTKITEITGHGMTQPVTDVLITTQGIVMFAQGDTTAIRWMREYNNAGVWTQEFRDDTGNKAVKLCYKPQAKKIVKANNSDAAGDVSIALADPVVWATGTHTFAAAIPIDTKYRKINGMIVYPDTGGVEAVWIFKTDIPFIAPGTGNPYPVNIPEMKNVRSPNNGSVSLLHNVYLLFSLQQGLQRYYGGQFDDIGPNLGDGMPENRRGPLCSMVGYPGKFFIAINAGTTGYSSILDSDGWHERYRAPKGQPIKAMGFQVVTGPQSDRLWIYQGNELIYIPFPSETANELEDGNHRYTHEFAVTFSRMHAGMFDVQKMIKTIKVQSEELEVDASGNNVCWIELDYRMNQDDAWETFDDTFIESPTQSIDLTSLYGLAAKRVQFRIRGYTADNTKTPVLLALIVNTVLRTDVKYIYPLQFRIMDNEPLLTLQDEENMTALEKLKMLEDMADSSSSSMLKVSSVSPLLHNRMIYLNPPTTRQIRFRDEQGNEFKRDVYICTASLQEA